MSGKRILLLISLLGLSLALMSCGGSETTVNVVVSARGTPALASGETATVGTSTALPTQAATATPVPATEVPPIATPPPATSTPAPAPPTATQAEPMTTPTPTSTAGQPAALALEIVSVTSPVSRGDVATLTAKTAPGALMTIEVLDRSGPSAIDGLGPKAADSSGNVSWSWKAGPRVALGEWRIVVSATSAGVKVTQTAFYVVQ